MGYLETGHPSPANTVDEVLQLKAAWNEVNVPLTLEFDSMPNRYVPFQLPGVEAVPTYFTLL